MLYLIESDIYAKVGYSKDYNTLEKRMVDYYTNNPNYTLVDVRDGTKDDEKMFHKLYNKYKLSGTEWCINKRLVFDLWIDKYKSSIMAENTSQKEPFTTYDDSAKLWKNDTLEAAIEAGKIGLEAAKYNEGISDYYSYLDDYRNEESTTI
jgi:hypothetical protein